MLPVLYALAAMLVDLLSGLLLLHPKASFLASRYTIAFASGVVLAAAFFELLPESNVKENATFVALGFFTFYLIEKVAMLHACGEEECETHHIGIVAVAGMASDNIVDGIGIAAGYFIDPALGLVTAIAVVAHEIPQAITSAAIMRSSNYSGRKVLLSLGVIGIMYPVGALLAAFVPERFYEAVLAFVAGDFIYIGAGDLLAEAHKKFNIKVIASVLFGAVLVVGVEVLTKSLLI